MIKEKENMKNKKFDGRVEIADKSSKEKEFTVPRKIDVKKDRKEIARIIKINLPLMNKNKQMCQEIADCILAYLMGVIK